MFQYKAIHNILPTKVSLFKAKISDNDIMPSMPHGQTFSRSHVFTLLFNFYLFGVYFKTGGLVKPKKTEYYP